MGNFEKLVVLVVLFLSAVVLAVSLSDGETEPGAGPAAALDGAAGFLDEPAGRVDDAGQTAQRPTSTRPTTGTPSSAKPGSAKRPALLDASPTAAERAPLSKLQIGGRESILVSRSGLTPSYVDDFMEYSVRDGDTWETIAQRFYGDLEQVPNLKVANDEPARLVPPMTILVPVFDLTEEGTDRAPFEPRDATLASKSGASKSAGALPNAVAGTTYVVKDGDNLSKIAKAVYGRSSAWEAIYEANRDKMKSSDWLTVGMELVIPANATMPAKASITEASAASSSKTGKVK